MAQNDSDTLGVFIGSTAATRAQLVDGHTVVLDTEAGVLSYYSPDCQAIHLQADLNQPPPPEVPNRHVSGAGRHGAALDSSYPRRAIARETESLLHGLARRAPNAKCIYFSASSGGGTGTGARDIVLKRVSGMHRLGHLIEIHEINPTINHVKQAQRLRDLIREAPAGVTSILVGDPEHLSEVFSIPAAGWDAINGITRNMHAVPSETEFSVMQVRQHVVSETVVVDRVLAGLLSRDIPARWLTGKSDLSDNQSARSLNDIRELLNTLPLRQTGIVDSDAIDLVARRGGRVVAIASQGVTDYATARAQASITADLATVAERLPMVGLRSIQPELEQLLHTFEFRTAQLEQELANRNWPQVVDNVVGDERRVSSRVGRMFGARTGRSAELHSFLQDETEFENLQFTVRELRNLLTAPVSPIGNTIPLYLPQRAAITETLVDVFFEADEMKRVPTLRGAIEERFAEIVVAALGSELPKLVEFAFPVTHDAAANTGMAIFSRFGTQIADLAEALHLNPMHVAARTVKGDAISLIHFGVIRRVRDVPALADLARRADATSAATQDRRLFVRAAQDIWPPLIRETRGVAPEHAAFVLAKAAIVPGALRMVHGKGAEMTLRSSPASVATYRSFDEFAQDLTVKAELDLHDSFWAYFAADRLKCRSEVCGLASGDPARHNPERLRAIQRFVQTRRWDTAVARLSQEVAIANEYWI